MRWHLLPAPDVLLVFIALPFLAALGLAVAAPLKRPSILLNHECTRLLTLALTSGILVNYAVGVVAPSLRWLWIADAVIAATAFAWGWRARRTAAVESLSIGWLRWLVFVAILLTFSGAILFEPLNEWDARSIWFFAAKRIYFGGGFDISGDWNLPGYAFSHADYPKLLPLLGAQFANAWGRWNEYVPKAGLLVLLAPVITGLLGLQLRLRWSLFFLVSVTLLTTREFVWNGYVDTYLALYAALSMLYLARWMHTLSALDISLGAAFMGVAVNLKNEGLLLAACMVISLLAWTMLLRRVRPTLQLRSVPATAWIALLLSAIGLFGWAILKHRLRLENDLQLGAGSFQRFLQRCLDGQIGEVLKGLYSRTDAGKAAILLVVIAVIAKCLKCRIPPFAWFPAAVAALYSVGMFGIYMATPHGLSWHIETSAQRTMLVTAFGFVASTFLIFEAIEARHSDRSLIDQTGLQA